MQRLRKWATQTAARLRQWGSQVLKFYEVRRTSVALYISICVFALLWWFGVFGQNAVVIGAIIGSVAIAVSSIGSDPVRDKWAVALLGTVLVGACAAADTMSTVGSITLRDELKEDMQSYGNEPKNKSGFVSYLNLRLSRCVNTLPVDPDHCDDLLSILEHVDALNGSVTYYKAEIFRLRGDLEDSESQFWRYLEEDERRRPATPDNGRADVCDSNATGYCRQRTAWVCHSLANDLYREGCAASAPAQRLDLFQQAQKKLACVKTEYPDGFRQRLHRRRLNTADLSEALGVQLGAPARTCDPPPPLRPSHGE
jgi:hypothetical protein